MISNVPDVIPIFPLPETVLLPSEVLPLHVFEPRYRDMVRDSLDTHRVIGMVLLQPGYERDYYGAPPVRDVGCAGLIARHQELADGRFLIWLLGIERFRIDRELPGAKSYRQVAINHEYVNATAEEQASIQAIRRDLLETIPRFIDPRVLADGEFGERLLKLDDAQFGAVAAQVLNLSGMEKQQMLESSTIVERYLILHEKLQVRRQELPELFPTDPENLN
ncbi:MAG: LON peptidase substrate-binding domain-containing protein [Deltaproteobacteria bacterium]|nr:LON peptidase substrate-binding domain-containing protein [Deltaproteobacteria bacterium]